MQVQHPHAVAVAEPRRVSLLPSGVQQQEVQACLALALDLALALAAAQVMAAGQAAVPEIESGWAVQDLSPPQHPSWLSPHAV